MFYKNRSTKDGYSHSCKKCHDIGAATRCQTWRKTYPQKFQEYKKNNRHKFWASNTLMSHKRRGFVVSISVGELETIGQKTKECLICDRPLGWDHGGKVHESSPTLDRINNERTISKDNVQIICHQCNTTKSSRTMKEFVDYCRRVSSKF